MPSFLNAVVMMVGILAPLLAAMTLDLITSAGAQMAVWNHVDIS